MKVKLLLAWRILVAAGMSAVLFVAGMVAYMFYKEHVRYYDKTDICHSYYSNNYIHEYKKGSVRIKEIKSGKYLTPKLDRIYDGSIRDSLTVFFQDGKRGFLNVYTGKIVIPAQYERAWVFSEGLGAVVKDGQLGFIGYNGETAIPFREKYNDKWKDKVDFLFTGGYCTLYDTTGKHGLIDKTGEWAIEPRYDYINNPVNGFRIVKDNGKYGLLDKTLQLILPIEYEWIVLQKEGVVVRKESDQKLLDLDGKTVLQPFIYDSVLELHYNSGRTNDAGEDIYVLSDYKSFSVGGKYGLMDKNGKIVAPAIYEYISAIGNDLFSCRVTGDNYFITMDGKGSVIQ